MALGRARDTWPGGGDPPAGASLYEAFSAGLALPEEREERLAALAALYRDHGDPLRAAWHEVAELLMDHDEGVGRWRHHHSLMAAREIGTRPGTGGSPGVEYLRTTVDRRFFPDLWDVRLEAAASGIARVAHASRFSRERMQRAARARARRASRCCRGAARVTRRHEQRQRSRAWTAIACLRSTTAPPSSAT